MPAILLGHRLQPDLACRHVGQDDAGASDLELTKYSITLQDGLLPQPHREPFRLTPRSRCQSRPTAVFELRLWDHI